MAPKMLGCLKKRDFLNRSAVSVDEAIQWGRRFEEEGLLCDAVDFFEKARAEEELERVLDRAVEDGDFFLFLRVARALKGEVDRKKCLPLAEQAKKLGKFSHAEKALEAAETDGGKKAAP